MSKQAVLMWAQRVIAHRTSPAHEIMELPPDTNPTQAQTAFHQIARTAHPDLHRNALTPEELEMVTTAYAIVAGAYQTLRSQPFSPTRTPPDPVERSGQTTPAAEPPVQAASTAPPVRATPVPTDAPSHAIPATPAGPAPAANAAQGMAPRALVYYRKAELSLKRGDLKGAVLQLKLAIAADPASVFLRTALSEVEVEVRKGT